MTTIFTVASNYKASETAATLSNASESLSSKTAVAAPLSGKTTTTISNLASQLAYSASVSDQTFSTMSDKELGNTGAKILATMLGNQSAAEKTKADNEIPDTTDPALLARAKQATAFLNGIIVGSGKGSSTEINPFAGLSPDQLSTITYDQSGTFTVNERRAAAYESAKQESQWRSVVVPKAAAEYNSTGKLTDFFSEVLAHFEGLPKIEQAQYPKNYASDLREKIDLDFNYLTGMPGQKKESNQVSAAKSDVASERSKDADIQAALHPRTNADDSSIAVSQ